MATEQCLNTPNNYISDHMTRMRHLVELKRAELFKQMAKSIDNCDMKQEVQCVIISRSLMMIDTCSNILRKRKFYKKIDIEPTLYEWSEERFEDRMAVNVLELQILQSINQKTLDIYKLLADLTNLKKAIEFLKKSSKKEFEEFIRGCKKMLTAYEDILALRNFLKKRLKRIENKINNYHVYEKNRIFEANVRLYETIDNYRNAILVNEPLQLRYQYHELLAQHEGLQHKWSRQEERKEQALSDMRNKINRESITINHTLNFYYGQFGLYHEKLKYWTWKYERDYEKETDKVTKTKLKLQAMRQRWSDCIARIEWFHKEIAATKERIRLAELRSAAEAAAEEALLKQKARQRKGKGKKRASGNGKKKIKGK